MRILRHWTVVHARAMTRVYKVFEYLVLRLRPLWQRIGMERLERPFAAGERLAKGALFDCQMCGQCVLSSTGMSCPMNCPKQMRNGPCGGVRANGNCEVIPDMPCVWVAAWEGNERLGSIDLARRALPPVDRRLQGKSAWLQFLREQPVEGKNGDLGTRS